MLPIELITPVYGAGAGNDEDDPYGASAGGDSESRHYAFDLGEEDEDVVVMGDQPSSRDSRTVKAGQRSVGGQDRWHDGRPVLAGWVLDVKGVPADKWYVRRPAILRPSDL